MDEITIIILHSLRDCLTKIILALELKKLQSSASSSRISTPPTERSLNHNDRPPGRPLDPNHSLPLWLRSWITKYGPAHWHGEEIFIGNCPAVCIHTKNLPHPERCAHTVHTEKHPNTDLCPWCLRQATTDPEL